MVATKQKSTRRTTRRGPRGEEDAHDTSSSTNFLEWKSFLLEDVPGETSSRAITDCHRSRIKSRRKFHSSLPLSLSLARPLLYCSFSRSFVQPTKYSHCCVTIKHTQRQLLQVLCCSGELLVPFRTLSTWTARESGEIITAAAAWTHDKDLSADLSVISGFVRIWVWVGRDSLWTGARDWLKNYQQGRGWNWHSTSGFCDFIPSERNSHTSREWLGKLRRSVLILTRTKVIKECR